MSIKDLRDGDHYFGRLLVADMRRCLSGKGKSYLSLSLQDKTGVIEAKKWDVDEGDEELFAKGKVLRIEGDVLLYNKALQMKIKSGSPVSQEEIDWGELLQSAPLTQEELTKKYQAYLDSLANPDIRKLVDEVVRLSQGRYFYWPGAVRNHHEFTCGLLYHSLTMADLAVKVCEVYPSLNRDIVLAGTLIHDIGKTIELSGPQACSFTLEGKLLGHVSLGFSLVDKAAHDIGLFAFDDLKEEEKTPDHPLYAKKELAVTIEHIMLSHHGKQEFGSPVIPLTREALAVSFIDDFDAKMMILDKAYEPIMPGESTAKIFSMDDRYFYKPTYAKENSSPAGLSLEEEMEAIK